MAGRYALFTRDMMYTCSTLLIRKWFIPFPYLEEAFKNSDTDPTQMC